MAGERRKSCKQSALIKLLNNVQRSVIVSERDLRRKARNSVDS